MGKNLIVIISILTLTTLINIITITGAEAVSPTIIKVDLNTTVNADNYILAIDRGSFCNGVWVNYSTNSGTSTNGPIGPAQAAGCSFSAADMFGSAGIYGHMLVSINKVNAVGELLSLEITDLISNSNQNIFGNSLGPVNKTNLELDRAIPEGTTVIYTVDMNGKNPHQVIVMGGKIPQVTYDSTSGLLAIESTTFSTTNAAGEYFSSISGFIIITDSALGSTPLQVLVQTNHWIGDIFPLFPGYDENAVGVTGGTIGTITAMSGITVYGITGETRNISIFFPDVTIEQIFGTGFNSGSLKPFVNNIEQNGSIITRDVSNFGTNGTLTEFSYTFTSPINASIGIDITSPNIVSVTPEDGVVDVSLDSLITVSFDDDMDASSISELTFSVSGDSNNISGIVTYGNKIATFTPSELLEYNKLYTVEISKNIKDLAGNLLENEKTWTFTSISEPLEYPAIISRVPDIDEVDVEVSSFITVNFSKNIDETTITEDSFKLTTTDGETVASAILVLGKKITLTPASPLNYNTVYTITVTDDVMDSDGNKMESINTWSFTTISNTEEETISDELPETVSEDDSEDSSSDGGGCFFNLTY